MNANTLMNTLATFATLPMAPLALLLSGLLIACQLRLLRLELSREEIRLHVVSRHEQLLALGLRSGMGIAVLGALLAIYAGLNASLRGAELLPVVIKMGLMPACAWLVGGIILYLAGAATQSAVNGAALNELRVAARYRSTEDGLRELRQIGELLREEKARKSKPVTARSIRVPPTSSPQMPPRAVLPTEMSQQRPVVQHSRQSDFQRNC